MESLTLWLIVLNMVLLGGVFALSHLKTRHVDWKLASDTSLRAAPASTATPRELGGLLGATESDLASLDTKVTALERDIGTNADYNALSADVMQLRMAFEQFASDVRSELNFVHSELRQRPTIGDATWISRVPARNAKKTGKKR